MPAHFQPLCAPTAFKPHISVGCGSSGGCAHSQPEGAPPTPCCRRGRPGGWSEALCVVRGAPGQANIVAEVQISFSHGFSRLLQVLGPPQRRPCPATWSEPAPYSGGDHVGAEAGTEQGGLQGVFTSPGDQDLGKAIGAGSAPTHIIKDTRAHNPRVRA